MTPLDDRPLGVDGAHARLDARASELGTTLDVDGPALLRERAAVLGIAPADTVSAGGTCHLLRAGDGRWVALNLARRDDVELLAAWMGHDWDGPVWDAVGEALTSMDAATAVERAQLLGIPASLAVAPYAPPVVARGTDQGGSARRLAGSLVVDLSALWAGPLCARLLGERGARVVKVEHVGRPDGGRAGPPAFWQRLNGGKQEVTLDFGSRDGRAALACLLDEATVVVTSARPRAIEQLGLDLANRIRKRGLVWVAITGHGYESTRREWVAFGDDAAVAGGVAVAAGGVDSPVFVGDAPADPIAGLQAAVAAAACLDDQTGAFVDISLVDAIAEAFASRQYARQSQQEVA